MSQKLSNKATCSKAYWSILKTFLNDKKIPCIPPVFHNKFVIDLEKKLNFLILLFLTKKRLSNVQISNENIIKIINNPDPNKTRGRDMISIQMYSVLLYVNHFNLILSHALVKWNFLWNGKKPMWFRSTKKMINSASKTTDLSLCFWSAVRSLEDFYLTNCTSFLMKMTYYHPSSQALGPVTLV